MAWYVVDGMDGSGKSTVAEMVVGNLESRGRKVLTVAHPDPNTFFGKVAARFLVSDSKVGAVGTSLFYFLDLLQSLSSMKTRSRSYDDVVFIRYTMAVGYFPGRMSAVAHRLLRKLLPFPDYAIFVDVDAETAMKRIVRRGEAIQIFESLDKLADTRRKMLSMTEGWEILDNSGTWEEMADAVGRFMDGVPTDN